MILKDDKFVIFSTEFYELCTTLSYIHNMAGVSKRREEYSSYHEAAMVEVLPVGGCGCGG